MTQRIITGQGDFVCHCIRLKRGEDLMESIRALCREKHIAAGIVLSGVGCILHGRIRDASGVTIRQIDEHCEIVIAELPGIRYDVEEDPETGYDELIFAQK